MKLLVVIGTRPEAIKMAPLIKRFRNTHGFEVRVCNTGQHKDLLEPVLDFFGITADYNLSVMQQDQGLHGLTAAIVQRTKPVFDEFRPAYVLVHGDTTTSFAAALSAFYSGIKVAHVEAGLRTFNKYAPFPEEINRSLTGRIADVHFAPTKAAIENLRKEGIVKDVILTGNTVIDSLLDAVKLIDDQTQGILQLKERIDTTKKIILFTGHRRENFGDGFEEIFSALRDILGKREDVIVVYPVHPNPNVKMLAEKYFLDNTKVHLVEPLGYDVFVWLMKQSYLILTDSGGIQEEAPSLGKPVLVLREVTERPEAVDAGTVILTGTDAEKIKTYCNRLLDDAAFYKATTSVSNPYGDGKASDRIISFFLEEAKSTSR